MVKKFIKDHSAIIISILINAVFLVGMLLLVGVHYELSDDWFISKNIANGSYDIVFCNYFVQILTGALQKIIYPYNAFIILQIAFGFLSLTTISYVFLKNFEFKKGICFALFVECVFAMNFYSLVTFTKTAGVLMVAGGLLMLWAYYNKKHIGYSIFGIVLVVLGSFYRFMIFYSVLAVFAFFIIASVLSKTQKGKFFRSLWDCIKSILSVKTVALVLVLMIAVFSCKYISTSIIYSTDDMEYYRAYNSARSRVVDWEISYYGTNEEAYKSIGMSRVDYDMLISWYFDDEGYADLETLQQVGEFSDRSIDPVARVKTMVAQQLTNMLTLEEDGIVLWAFLVAAIAIILIYKKSLLFVCFLTVPVAMLYSYLYIDGRIKYRVVVGFLLAAVVLMLYATSLMTKRDLVSRIKEKSKKCTSVLALLCSVAVSIVFLGITTTVQLPALDFEIEFDEGNLKKYIVESEDKHFALSRYAYTLVKNSEFVSDPMYIGYNEFIDKCVYFGTPYYAHPSYNKLLANIGVDNLYSDIIDNENLYFVGSIHEKTSEIDLFIDYINEQYGTDSSKYVYEVVDFVEDSSTVYSENMKDLKFGIYRIITVEK